MSGPVLGIIPARGGSKGIPGKNIRLIGGRPLLEYTVRSAQASGIIDRLILTTDSPEIAAVGESLGVEAPFLRPAELAGDQTPTLPVVEHAVAFLEERGWTPEIVLLLQPTAPLRKPQHILRAVDLLRTLEVDSVVSVVEVPRHFAPQYVMKIEDGRLHPYLPEGGSITRRQDARPAYYRDGTIYAVWRDVLMNSHSLYGERCHPLLLAADETVTLDAPEDWEAAERRLASFGS